MAKKVVPAGDQSAQIARIRHFEELLDRISEAVKTYENAAGALEGLRSEIDELAAYYGSALWKKDYADDEAGLLPKDLKRGVLSEDAVYDLLEELEEIGEYLPENGEKKEVGTVLTLERAKELNDAQVTERHLVIHAKNVMYAMGAMAERFGEDREHWMAVGYLHDYDYEKYPEEHLRHTEKELLAEGVDAADVRAILSHGYGHCTNVMPETNMEKSLYTVDELTGIIQACARMRPLGIRDLEVRSFMKKFKDRKFAAKCDRDLIVKGCEMLGMEVAEVAQICIEGMKPYAEEIELVGTGAP